MPTGQTPQPMIQGLPYGDNQQANDLLDQLAQPPAYATPQEADQPDETFQPSGDAEKFLYSGTDRPDEPITHGAPFGDGAHFTPFALSSEQDFSRGVASELASTPSPEVKKLAARLERGL